MKNTQNNLFVHRLGLFNSLIVGKSTAVIARHPRFSLYRFFHSNPSERNKNFVKQLYLDPKLCFNSIYFRDMFSKYYHKEQGLKELLYNDTICCCMFKAKFKNGEFRMLSSQFGFHFELKHLD
jgi:hypothetical protein